MASINDLTELFKTHNKKIIGLVGACVVTYCLKELKNKNDNKNKEGGESKLLTKEEIKKVKHIYLLLICTLNIL